MVLDEFIFTATVRASIDPMGGEEATVARLHALLAGDIWRPLGVATVEGDDVLIEVSTAFPTETFIADDESEASVEQQAANYAADELEDVLAGSDFRLDGEVAPSESF